MKVELANCPQPRCEGALYNVQEWVSLTTSRPCRRQDMIRGIEAVSGTDYGSAVVDDRSVMIPQLWRFQNCPRAAEVIRRLALAEARECIGFSPLLATGMDITHSLNTASPLCIAALK